MNVKYKHNKQLVVQSGWLHCGCTGCPVAWATVTSSVLGFLGGKIRWVCLHGQQHRAVVATTPTCV